ncbi:AMP phosphorylase [archaeon]|nr:AMP phosphorylase [archaeon]
MIKLKATFLDFEMGIPIVMMHVEDARDVGVFPGDRVLIRYNSKAEKIAFVETTTQLVKEGQIGIRREAKEKYGVIKGTILFVSPVMKPRSVEFIKKKLDGIELKDSEINEIIHDVATNRLTDIELGAFVSGVYTRGFNDKEVLAVTRAMVYEGDSLKWNKKYVVDKHSIGGVPGNRVTPIVVAIVAAAGLTIPKTSSRAITSPAGTADTMEVFCNVSFSVDEIKQIVNKTNGCLVWGGALDLAPADDKLIRAEYPLSLDPEGQVLASVMSKKKSVGSKYVVIDLPFGDGAKVKSFEDAKRLAIKFKKLGASLEMHIECTLTKGDQPIGNGVGPVLEAIDIMEVLFGRGPIDLFEKSVELAGVILSMTGKGNEKTAKELIDSGAALEKFKQIVVAQGGTADKDLDKLLSKKKISVYAKKTGTVLSVNNKVIADIAKRAGAPKDIGAGVYVYVKRWQTIKKGDKLLDIYSSKEYKIKSVEELLSEFESCVIGSDKDMTVEVV